ncbi:MAG: ribosomal protein S18-alanine N-acetyltransferase [Acidobacteria bacterium]|nr:ribosomal protein S18-alanine N-acetyltransferase [Acidobacteriota bacterium]
MSGEALVLEEAGLEDLEALALLERRSFSHPWAVSGLREALAASGRGLFLVLRAPFGRGDPERGIRAYCVFETVVDEMHIHNLAVHPDHRRRGLGRRLLRLALETARGRGAETAHLEVRASNWAALALYRALGFETTGVRRGYYTGPCEDALLLRRSGLRDQS